MRKFLVVLATSLFVAGSTYAQKPRLNPAHVMGAKACTECHGKEIEAWRATKHFKTFSVLEDSDKAIDIADAMGVDDLTKDALCIECHYTIQNKGGGNTAISGISCESCHGASKGWIKEHNKETVSREARKGVAVKAGMIYPQDLYAVARNCFDCHIVSREDLVNKGGHPAFSKDFDLSAWSQGEVRHSFMTDASPVKKAGETNRAASPERKRMLYMVGKLLSLEYSLRAVAKATTAGKLPSGEHAYGVQVAIRANGLIKEVDALNKMVPTTEVTGIVAAAKAVKLKTKNQAPLTAAANKIAALSKQFASKHDGSKFAAIDAKIPAPHGKIFKP